MKRLLCVAAMSALCCSCAALYRKNLPLMYQCQRHLVPENPTTRWLTAPITVPVCLGAAAVDFAVLRPFSVADDAWYDTEAALWDFEGTTLDYVLLPLRVAATPLLWGLDFASRWFFPFPDYPPSPKRLERRLLDPDPNIRMWVVEDLRPFSYRGDDRGPATRAMVKACRKYAKDTRFVRAAMIRLPAPLTDDGWNYMVHLVRTDKGDLCIEAMYQLLRQCYSLRAKYLELRENPPQMPEALRKLSPQALGRLLDAAPAPGPKAPPPADANLAAVARGFRKQMETWKNDLRDRRAAWEARLNGLARLYDDLIRTGNRYGELHMAIAVGQLTRWPSPRALALYVARSLERRGTPVYAEGAAFLVQRRLLLHAAGRVDAMAHEWRAGLLGREWPLYVQAALDRLSKGGRPLDKKRLVQQQKLIAAKVRRTESGRAADLLQWTEDLVRFKTLLDAEETAEKLMRATKEDRALFLVSLKHLMPGRGARKGRR